MQTKFLSFIMFLAVASIGCEQEDLSPTSDETTLFTFASLATSATSNAVSDSTSTKCVGKRSQLTEVEVSALSTAITSYITANYAGATIERAGKTS